MFSALWYVTRPRGTQGTSLIEDVVESATGNIEAWAGEQIQLIANDLLNPSLAFERFEFELPVTCTFHDVRLEADGHTVLAAEAIRVELRERPVVGEPIVIEAITLTAPTFRLVTLPDGEMAGFSDLLKSTTGTVHDDGSSSRPSEIFAIRRLRLTDGTIRVEPAEGRSMTLDALDLDLANQPETEGGWYGIDGTIGRPDTLSVDLDARFNIDTGVVALAPTMITATVARDRYEAFPPDLQDVFSTLSLAGNLEMTVEGTLPLRDMPAASLVMSLELDDAHAWVDRYQMPIDRVDADGSLSGGMLQIDRLVARLLGGTIEANAKLRLDEARTAVAEWTAANLQLRDLIRDPESRLSGSIQSSGGVSMDLATGLDSIGGQGKVQITNGELLDQALFGGLMSTFGASGDDKGTDRGMATIDLTSSGMTLSDIELISRTTAARGDGTVSWAGALDLRFNGGPLERLQAELGAVGEILGSLTDTLLKYHVTGTTEDPIFKVRPLGLGG